jgi:hypothetical protein
MGGVNMNGKFLSNVAGFFSAGSPGVRAGTDACRYLAAAAYHDGAFRDSVLEFFRHRWYRAPAPEFGIDEALVHQHCRYADLRELIRNIAMLLVFLVVAGAPILSLLSEPQAAKEILAESALNFIIVLCLSGLIMFAERLHTEHFLIAKQFSRDRFINIDTPVLSDVEAQNLVAYGGYAPFVGSGYGLGGWSFSVNLERTKEEFGKAVKAQPFDSRGLLTYIQQRMDRLRNNNLRYREVLFADGRLLRDNASRLMQDGQPRRRVSADTLEKLSDSSAAGTRSYLCVHIADWSGELVISIYFRCKKYESSLFFEASYFILPPPKRAFFRIDEAELELRPSTIARLLVTSLLLTPLVIVKAAVQIPSRLLAPLSHWLERRRIRRSITRNPRFNFGAVTSIRELGMENYFRVYFQQLDRERHVKTVEQCAIDAIIEFLDAHNIDTSDIRDRRQAVLNTGVIVSGGDFNAGNVAVGSNARATMSRLGARIGVSGSTQRVSGSTQSMPQQTGAS